MIERAAFIDSVRAADGKKNVLCCNYDFSSFSLGRHVKPYAIYKRGGFKIGVIGLLFDVRTVVTAETASKLVYLSPSEQAKGRRTFPCESH